ncbi:MAG: ABC transporter permease [Acidimicrobiales bacterium]
MKKTVRSGRGLLWSALRSERSPLQLVVVAVALFGVFTALDPTVFPSVSDLQAMGFQLPAEALLGLAVMFSMVMGGIDLSVVAIADLSGVVAVSFFGAVHSSSWLTMVAGGLLALLVGVSAGAINGFLIGGIGVTAILATLCTSDIFSGLATGLTKGVALLTVPAGLLTLGDGLVGGVPVAMIVFLVLAVVSGFLLSRTATGFRLRLSGANPKAAELSGIDQFRAQMVTYIVSGALSAVAGMIFVALEDSATPDYGQSYLLLAVLVSVFGGTALTGGFASASGTILAAVALVMLSTGTVLLHMNQYLYEALEGALVIAVMVGRQELQGIGGSGGEREGLVDVIEGVGDVGGRTGATVSSREGVGHGRSTVE